MTQPTLTSEIDFEGNPTATYHDTLFYDDATQSYWRMSDNATLVDEKELNDGTIQGAPTLVSGMLALDSDQALSFDGVDDGATVPSSASLLQSGSWSLKGWMKPPSIPASTKDVVCKAGSFAVQLRSDGKLQGWVKNDQSGTLTLTTVVSSTVLEVDGEYLVELVHDAVTDELRLYVNGVLEDSAAHTVGTELIANPLVFAQRIGATAPAWQSTQTGNNTSTAPTANKPASTASGDLLLAHLDVMSTTATATAPTGWTLLTDSVGADRRTRVYWKIADGTEGASFAWTLSASAVWGLAISRFTGVNSAQLFANPAYATEQGVVGATQSTGTHRPAFDNCLVLGLFVSRNIGAWTANDGTQRYDLSTGNQRLMMSTQTGQSDTSLAVTASQTNPHSGSSIMVVLSGSGYSQHLEVELDEWVFSTNADDDDEAMDAYVARLSGTGAWTDVTADSKGFSVTRERQYELDRFEAGVLRETLRDDDRNYDPSNAESIYYPNVKTKRRHRLRATVGAETFPVFEGFVERWPQSWLAPEYQEVNLTASDGMAALALAPVSGTLTSTLSGAQIHRLLDLARWPRDLRNIDDGQFIMDVWALSDGQKALAAIQEIADSELGQFFISADGIATFHDYARRWTNTRSLNVQATFSDVDADVAAGAIPYLFGGVSPSFDDDTTINRWTVSTASGDSATVADVVGAREAFSLAESRSTRLASVADAETQALALLQRTARPGQRFDKLTVTPNDVTRWQTVLGLEVSDLVRFVRTPSVGSQITQDCFVEGVEIEGPPGEPWTVTLALSPVSTASFYETAVRSGPVSYYRMDEETA